MKKFVLGGLILASSTSTAFGHAISGDRVFPATMAVDDPGVSEELNTQVNSFKTPNDEGENLRSTDESFEFDQLITRDLAISVDGAYIEQDNGGMAGDSDGFDNFGVGVKYQAWVDPDAEAIVSVGVDSDIGRTGSKLVGADDFTTFTPTVYAGKGFGDLPDSLDYLKPFAITGTLGFDVPTSTENRDGDQNPNALEYGFTVQYSVPYLQQHVKDLGIGQPFANLVPVVEVALTQPTDRSENNALTGTVNPGIIWMGQEEQFGLEATLPVNNRSGNGVGFIAQVHFYIDDLFPTSLGRPIW